MRRVPLLDGLRGYFLVFMLITHLFGGRYALVRINHAELGFVQDAQGFVFLSGLLVGALYGRRMLRDGFSAAAGLIWQRAAMLYLCTLALLLSVLLLRLILPGADLIWSTWLGVLPTGTPAAAITAALLLYQPTFFDILPQYVLYLAAAPPLLWLTLNGHARAVLAGSALLWLAMQFGAQDVLADAINGVLGLWQEELRIRSAFNPLAWQIVFMSAMVLGALWTQGRLDVGAILDPQRPARAIVAAIVVAFFCAWRLAFTFGLVQPGVMAAFQHFENRPEFSVVFLTNFVALGYLVAWLLVAGGATRSRAVQAISTALNRLFNLPFLRLLGRHSLQVYAWHVLVVYVAVWVDGWFGPFDSLTRSAIGLACVALLAVPSAIVEWRDRRREAVAVPAE